MAIQSKTLSIAENGAFVLSFTFDDVSLVIQTIDCIHNGEKTYTLSATRINNGQNYQFDIQPGTEIHQNIPQGAATRLGLTLVQPGNKLGGVSWSIASQAL